MSVTFAQSFSIWHDLALLQMRELLVASLSICRTCECVVLELLQPKISYLHGATSTYSQFGATISCMQAW